MNWEGIVAGIVVALLIGFLVIAKLSQIIVAVQDEPRLQKKPWYIKLLAAIALIFIVIVSYVAR